MIGICADEWTLECLRSLSHMDDRDIIDQLNQCRAHAKSISAACAVKAHDGHAYDREMLDLALSCPFLSDEERETWTAINRKAPKPKPPPREGFVYLMKNTRNGLVKIGFSRQPKHRESTLQSEEPEVELLAAKPGSTAKERDMHARFAPQRVRGEWFRLTDPDVETARGILAQ